VFIFGVATKFNFVLSILKFVINDNTIRLAVAAPFNPFLMARLDLRLVSHRADDDSEVRWVIKLDVDASLIFIGFNHPQPLSPF